MTVKDNTRWPEGWKSSCYSTQLERLYLHSMKWWVVKKQQTFELPQLTTTTSDAQQKSLGKDCLSGGLYLGAGRGGCIYLPFPRIISEGARRSAPSSLGKLNSCCLLWWGQKCCYVLSDHLTFTWETFWEVLWVVLLQFPGFLSNINFISGHLSQGLMFAYNVCIYYLSIPNPNPSTQQTIPEAA